MPALAISDIPFLASQQATGGLAVRWDPEIGNGYDYSDCNNGVILVYDNARSGTDISARIYFYGQFPCF